MSSRIETPLASRPQSQMSQRTYSDVYPASSEFSSVISTGNGTGLPPLDMSMYEVSPYKRVENSSGETSPSTDSGVSDLSFHQLERGELEAQCGGLIREIRTVAQLTEDFRRDILGEMESPSDLLDELETKIRPYLIRLDEEIAALEALCRKNLDRCRITDNRVAWLLHYNRFILEFRRMIGALTLDIFEELEKGLRLLVRGCVTTDIRHVQIARNLSQMMETLADLESKKVFKESKT